VTSEEIAERLELFIRKQFAIASSDGRFSRSALLFENGYVDSVGAVELLAFVQDKFGVVVPDEQLLSEEFSTIDGIATIISRVRNAPVEATVRG
jgi:acyl carrier protein